jgi:acetyl-CoA C-acetyltransferase
VEATTVNKMCGSGMQAVTMAAEAIASVSIDVALAGGMESMTGAPYILAKYRTGARIGHDQIIDSLMMDGLEDAYAPGKLMGAFDPPRSSSPALNSCVGSGKSVQTREA